MRLKNISLFTSGSRGASQPNFWEILDPPLLFRTKIKSIPGGTELLSTNKSTSQLGLIDCSHRTKAEEKAKYKDQRINDKLQTKFSLSLCVNEILMFRKPECQSGPFHTEFYDKC